jgi:hypothetical protein
MRSEQVRLQAINFLRKESGPYQQQLRAMAEFRFDPPLTLKGNIVVRNLDDAVRFMIGYREARRPELQTSVLYRLERAAGETEERHAGYAFRGPEAEGLIIKLDE